MRVPGSLASDVRSLDALKAGAAKDPKGAVRQAATQFEALFMQMVLKSMRDAVPRSGMLEGTGADVYKGMLDTQFAQAMAGRPGGLGELIANDPDGNAVRGDVVQSETRNSVIWSETGRLIALVGLENIAVVDTEDALLVINRDRAQDVRRIVDQLKQKRRHSYQ